MCAWVGVCVPGCVCMWMQAVGGCAGRWGRRACVCESPGVRVEEGGGVGGAGQLGGRGLISVGLGSTPGGVWDCPSPGHSGLPTSAPVGHRGECCHECPGLAPCGDQQGRAPWPEAGWGPDVGCLREEQGRPHPVGTGDPGDRQPGDKDGPLPLSLGLDRGGTTWAVISPRGPGGLHPSVHTQQPEQVCQEGSPQERPPQAKLPPRPRAAPRGPVQTSTDRVWPRWDLSPRRHGDASSPEPVLSLAPRVAPALGLCLGKNHDSVAGARVVLGALFHAGPGRMYTALGLR